MSKHMIEPITLKRGLVMNRINLHNAEMYTDI